MKKTILIMSIIAMSAGLQAKSMDGECQHFKMQGKNEMFKELNLTDVQIQKLQDFKKAEKMEKATKLKEALSLTEEQSVKFNEIMEKADGNKNRKEKGEGKLNRKDKYKAEMEELSVRLGLNDDQVKELMLFNEEKMKEKRQRGDRK